MYSESQLKRIERWAYNNAPVAWADDGLPELLADKDGGTSGVRQVVQGLLRDFRDLERSLENARKDADAAWEAKKLATSTRIDETARVILAAAFNDLEVNLTKGEAAADAYLWAQILENARPKEKP